MSNKKYNSESTTETRVHLANDYNSTPFTDCCEVAAISEKRCPSCGNIVYPYAPSQRFSSAFNR